MPSCAKDSIAARAVVRLLRFYYISGAFNTSVSTHAMRYFHLHNEDCRAVFCRVIYLIIQGQYIIKYNHASTADVSSSTGAAGGIMCAQRPLTTVPRWMAANRSA